MKSTPLYELLVALRGRSKIFQSIVIGSFTASIFVIAICGSQLLKTPGSESLQSSKIQHRTSAMPMASISQR
ncbi:MAG TPA: hypothetical protein VF609_14130 [Flavisolibacter sp.]|jgi:hypothetical protein